MDHETAVEKLVESLSFEVEAVPQDNIPQYKSTSHITPVNVKVRVRKKEKSGMQKGTICIPKVARTDHYPERIRLASSDQTIMSFNVLMEDPDNRKSKKKNVFGGCLTGTTEDDDDGPYLPKEEASGSKSGHKQKLALSKTARNQFSPGDVERKPKTFFGPCKPGGCLDPPFGEDRYQYRRSDTKTPKHPSIDNKINMKTPKHPSIDKINTNKCPNNFNTEVTEKCPSFDYKVNTITPLSFGNAVEISKESNDTLKGNNFPQHKRKRSSSNSASTVKITKKPSGSSNSVQSLYTEKRAEPPLEDKESYSIITYAEDKDNIDKERLNKHRKSSAGTNRTSFDLNAPYFTPPKRDIYKDSNDKKEKLRKSFEPLGKVQDESYLDDVDAKQKKILRMEIDLESEHTASTGENDQLDRNTEDTLTKNKSKESPFVENGSIDKLKAYVGIPLNANGNTEKYRDGVFLKSSEDDKNIPKTNIQNQDDNITHPMYYKNSGGPIEKYKTDDTFTAEFENVKESDKQSKPYANLPKYSNSYVSESDTPPKKYSDLTIQSTPAISESDKEPKYYADLLGTGTIKEINFDTQSGLDTGDLTNADSSRSGIIDRNIYLEKDSDIKHPQLAKEILKRGLESEIGQDNFGFNSPEKEVSNAFRESVNKNQESGYIERIMDSFSHDANKETLKYSFNKLDNKDIVTVNPDTFYKDISDAESDVKIISEMNKIYDIKDNRATVHTATDIDLNPLINSPFTNISINSKDNLDIDNTVLSSHHVASISSQDFDGDGYEAGGANASRDKKIKILKYDELSTKSDKDAKKLAWDISLDLAFQNSFNGRQRVLKTLETPLNSKLQSDPDVITVQKRLTLDGEKTQILIDPETDMTIQLNRHSIDSFQQKDRIYKGLIPEDHAPADSHHHHIHPHVSFSNEHLHENLSYLYEKELVPLKNMIQDLKAEIDALAGQHKRRERAVQLNKRLRPVKHCSGIVIRKYT